MNNFWDWLGRCVVFAPAALVFVLGGSALAGIRLSEKTQARATKLFVSIGLFSAIAILIRMLLTDSHYVPIAFGDWVVLHECDFHFSAKVIFDRLSIPVCILTYLLCGTIAAFAAKYLHRDAGFRRFFMLYSIFLLGMILAVLAGTIEMLFTGWEMVGLSSALLVAYFHERTAPVENGHRVWTVYRIADAAFLIAAVLLHHMSGAGDFANCVGSDTWPEGCTILTSHQAFYVGLLLMIAVAGKSALIPFSGWLPRAMEGPTPSSAVFYGALSVHLGVYLLLRVSPILNASPGLEWIVIIWGACSAILASIIVRVQTDAKSALAYSSLTQVSLIVVEIGFGFRYLALVHLIGHACLRTLQLLRAPTMLRDHHLLENAVGQHLIWGGSDESQKIPEWLRNWLYRLAVERGYWDHALDNWLVRPFMTVFQTCNALEESWTKVLRGKSPAKPPQPPHWSLLDESR